MAVAVSMIQAAVDPVEAAAPNERSTVSIQAQGERPRADGSGGLSLQQAVARALREGFTTQIAELETDQARDVALRTLGAYLPQLAISSKAGWSNRINEKIVAGDGQVYGLDNLGNEPWVDVFVQQALLDLPLWQRIKRENLGTKLAELAESQVREAVAYEVLRLYSSLSRVEQLRDVDEMHHLGLCELGKRAEDLWEAGRILESQRAAIFVARDEAALSVETRELELATLRAELRLALGEDGDPAAMGPTVPASLPPADTLEFPEGLDSAILRTPDVEILALRQRIEGASVSVVAAERWPTLVLRGGYANYGIKRFDEFEDEGYIFMGMEVPLFDGLQNKHALSGAQKALDIARLRYRSGIARMRTTLKSLNRELEVLGRRVELAERREKAAFSGSRIATVNLEAQRGNLLESVLARERLREASTALIDLRFTQLNVWARLHRKLGRLTSTLGDGAVTGP